MPRRSDQSLEFQVTSDDHGASYSCRSLAETTMVEPQETEFKVTYNVTCKWMGLCKTWIINFHFAVPPESVTIKGATALSVDRTFTYECNVLNANPAPQVYWVVNGERVPSTSVRQIAPPVLSARDLYKNNPLATGWTVKAELSLTVVEEDSDLSLSCAAVSPAQGVPTVDTLKIMVLSKACRTIWELHLNTTQFQNLLVLLWSLVCQKIKLWEKANSSNLLAHPMTDLQFQNFPGTEETPNLAKETSRSIGVPIQAHLLK